MKRIVCEMCNSTDLVKQDGLFVCQYCGTKYSVDEARKMMVDEDGVVTVKVDDSSKIENYLSMAQSALDSSNNKEAESYCNKILEVDQSNYRAWIIKSQAAGWQTTLAYPRLDEALSCLEKAIAVVPEEELEEVAAEANDIMQNLLLAMAVLQLNMITSYPDSAKLKEYFDLKFDLMTKGITVQIAYGGRMKAINEGKPEEEKKPLTSFGCLKFTEALDEKVFAASIKIWNEMMARYKEDAYPIDYVFEECSKNGLVAIQLLGTIIPDDVSKVEAKDVSKVIKYIKNMITMKDTYGGLKSYTTSYSNGIKSHPLSKCFNDSYKKQLADDVTELRNKALQLDPNVVLPKTQSEIEAERKAEFAKAQAEKLEKKKEQKDNRNKGMVWLFALIAKVLYSLAYTLVYSLIFGKVMMKAGSSNALASNIISSVLFIAIITVLAVLGFGVILPKKKNVNVKGVVIRAIVWVVLSRYVVQPVVYAMGGMYGLSVELTSIWYVSVGYLIDILFAVPVFSYADNCEMKNKVESSEVKKEE